MKTDDLTQTTFTRMQDATHDDYTKIASHGAVFRKSRVERILAQLELLAGHTGGYAIDRLAHSLQSATRAHQDGRDDEYVVCALLHDIGDTLASSPANHSQLAATVLEPYVSDRNYWIVKHHGLFQGYYFFHHLGLDRNLRDRYRDHEYFDDCAEFCELYDQNCFDPNFQNLPISYFRSMVDIVFGSLKRSKHTSE